MRDMKAWMPAAALIAASLALGASAQANVSAHAPYEAGDCRICHQSADPKKPGPVVKQGPALCLDCHDEFAAVLKRPVVHASAKAGCVSCHDPHGSRQPKLLRDARGPLCIGCHADVGKSIASAVKHRPVAEGGQCLQCHDPHATSVEKLLVKQPFELCISCHDRDAMSGAGGRKLQNIKAWLDANPVAHGPVAGRDCSACHEPHGGDHFRLLKDDYPPEFYAPYDPRQYSLCLSCHREAAFSTAQTTTLTNFRDGARNLHFVHLQQAGRGRTCRACHEVHASKQAHHIREGVPYGSGGWILKLNYKKTDSGGSCDKTCHGEKVYSTRKAP